MSYEYKVRVAELIEYYVLFEGEELAIQEELEHVYAQAPKADEYEKNKYRTHVNDRKAEAFDAILKAYDEAFSREHMAGEVSNIIEEYETENI